MGKRNTNQSNKELLEDLGANFGNDSDGEVEENEVQNVETSAAEGRVESAAKLTNRLMSMSADERLMFGKIVQFQAIKDMLTALENLKNTTPGTWQNVISGLKFAKAFSFKDKDVDFDPSAFFDKILPLVGALAGALIAAKAADVEEIVTDTPTEEEKAQTRNELKKDFNEAKQKSIILTMCDEKTNGFSL